MSFKFYRKLSLGGFKAALSGWTGRRAASRASHRAQEGSPWRPCPGVYALLVDIHRNH
jgi:hypothetical protein